MPYPPRTTVFFKPKGPQAKPTRGPKFLYLAEELCGPRMLRMNSQLRMTVVREGQALFWSVSPKELKSTSQRSPKLRVRLGLMRQSSCTNSPRYLLWDIGAKGGRTGAALFRANEMGMSRSSMTPSLFRSWVAK